MVAHTTNPSTQEAEASGLPYVQGQPGLHEFKVILEYRVRPCLERKEKKKSGVMGAKETYIHQDER